MSFQDISGGSSNTPSGGRRGRGPDIKTLGDGRYRIIKMVGRGGMAVVYHAYDTANDRDVAIKLLSLDLATEESFLERFQRESELMRDLNHPNILRAYDYGQDGDLVYLVMSYFGGGTLKDRITQGALPLATVADYLSQVANGLGYAHSRGIVHRDVKPSNVLVHHASEKLVLSDFGIAKALSNANPARTGTIMGTPLYMAPEQFLAGGDQRADIYALGIVLYQMLTGEVPFRGEGIGFKHMTEPVPPLRTFGIDYEPALEAIVMKALAKRPEARFQKVEELALAFRNAVRDYSQSETRLDVGSEKPPQAQFSAPWTDASGAEDSGILPGQDSLSAVSLVVPSATTPLRLPDEPVLNSNSVSFQATDLASPVSTAGSGSKEAKKPAPDFGSSRPTDPLPAVTTGSVNPPPPSVARSYTPLQNLPPQPNLPLARSRPVLAEEDTSRYVSQKERVQRRGKMGPLVGLLAGIIIVLALGGGVLFFLLNYSNTNVKATPTAGQEAVLPGQGTASVLPAATSTPAINTPAATKAGSATPGGGTGAQITQVTGPLPRKAKMVFTSVDASNKQNIFFYDETVGLLKQLTTTGRDSQPVWSPNGQMIVFQRLREDGSGYDIWKMSADGRAEVKIVPFAYNPAFTHQGSSIVYYSEQDRDLFIVLVDSSTPNPVRLTNDGKTKYGPVFSPDDKRIAYAQDDEQGVRQVYIIDNKPSATPFKLTNCSSFNCVWPAWSPDGKQLAFSTNDKNGLAGEIWTIMVDGSRATAIVNTVDGRVHNSHPVWVEDYRGRSTSSIYFNSDRGDGNKGRIYVANPDGSEQRQLVKHPGSDGADNAPLDDYGVSVFPLGT